tara:strand:+ start:1069 stop:1284 length:216 start_codon:yes stop_codon:yes gene_type:complete
MISIFGKGEKNEYIYIYIKDEKVASLWIIVGVGCVVCGNVPSCKCKRAEYTKKRCDIRRHEYRDTEPDGGS